MKFVTWNCNGAFRKKLCALDEFDADIIIIQECEDPERSTHEFRDWAGFGDYLWKGENKSKGTGVFARNGISLQKLNWDDHGLQSFVPFRVNNQFNMLGVWTKEANSPTFKYIGQFWKYLQQNKDRLIYEPTVICGDFNSNKIWDIGDRWWNHSDVVRELEEIGIVSLYHALHRESQGAESRPTLYLHRKVEKPYHIDYVFVSKRLCNDAELTVGDPRQWLEYSDHMPIVFTVSMA